MQNLSEQEEDVSEVPFVKGMTLEQYLAKASFESEPLDNKTAEHEEENLLESSGFGGLTGKVINNN